jgi:UDPglucose 6-dehydrogenase
MHVAIIGTGFVGVVSAAVYASFGHAVIGLDIDEAKVSSLKNGVVPFYEPDLEELLVEQQKAGNLTFTTSYQEAISHADVIIIAVGTPSKSDGAADLSYVYASCDALAEYIQPNTIVVVKSTVPPGTLVSVTERISSATPTPFFTASMPEFLREGSAVSDTLHPDRVLIGANEPEVVKTLSELHRALKAEILVMAPESAQMAKYAANAYLATRITFANQLANVCELAGADISDVIRGMGKDARIGSHYWYPGLGYGGSCFPKDVRELASFSRARGMDGNLFTVIDELNSERPAELFAQYTKAVGSWKDKSVAVLGLSFKPHTNDMREAPCLHIIPHLLEAGATIRAYDPMANQEAATLFAHKGWLQDDQLKIVDRLADAVIDADVVLQLVEWPELLAYEYQAPEQKSSWFIDLRNQFDPDTVRTWGYTYLGTGRL